MMCAVSFSLVVCDSDTDGLFFELALEANQDREEMALKTEIK
jgi:hypothetical protein